MDMVYDGGEDDDDDDDDDEFYRVKNEDLTR